MKTSSRNLRRRAADVMQRVDAGETVELTWHGAAVAQIVPVLKSRTGREIAALLRNAPRVGVEVAGDVARALRRLDAAA